MKTLALIIFSLAAFFPLKADEELKNPDFTDGRSHWEGDGESLNSAVNADAAPTLTEHNVTGVSGLLIKLSRRDWMSVSQDFRPLGSAGKLTVVYKLSDDIAFSTITDDYVNVPAHMGFNAFMSFNIPPGHWIALFLETARNEMDYYNVTPKSGSATQTYKDNITNLVPREDKTICLAFPPGSGTITIYHVGFESNASTPSP